MICAIFPAYKIGIEIIEMINDDQVIMPPKIDFTGLPPHISTLSEPMVSQFIRIENFYGEGKPCLANVDKGINRSC